MNNEISVETLLKEFLTPIICDAVDQAMEKYHSTTTPAQQQSLPELMDVKMTAAYLHIAVPTVYGLVHKRTIPYYKRRLRLYFKKEDLDNWIAGGRRMTVDEIQQAALESLGGEIGGDEELPECTIANLFYL